MPLQRAEIDLRVFLEVEPCHTNHDFIIPQLPQAPIGIAQVVVGGMHEILVPVDSAVPVLDQQLIGQALTLRVVSLAERYPVDVTHTIAIYVAHAGTVLIKARYLGDHAGEGGIFVDEIVHTIDEQEFRYSFVPALDGIHDVGKGQIIGPVDIGPLYRLPPSCLHEITIKKFAAAFERAYIHEIAPSRALNVTILVKSIIFIESWVDFYHMQLVQQFYL